MCWSQLILFVSRCLARIIILFRLQFPGVPYPAAYRNKVVYAIPVGDRDKITIMWSLPGVLSKNREAPLDYLSHLLGHEGTGSVLALLKKKGWASALAVGTSLASKRFTLWECEITLTKAGLDGQHWKNVVALVFQYLRMIRDHGIQKWRFDEVKQLAEIEFRFAEKQNSATYVSDMAKRMNLPIEDLDLLGAPQRLRWDEATVKEMAALSADPAHAIVTVFSRSFESAEMQAQIGADLDSVEPVYGTKYHMRDFLPGELKFWTQDVAASPQLTAAELKSLALPEANPYIPNDLNLLPPPAEGQFNGKAPMMVRNESNGKSIAWWRQSQSHQRPVVHIHVRAFSQQTYSSALARVYCKLIPLIVEDLLKEDVYLAQLAGYSYTYSIDTTGVSLTVTGYSDRIEAYLKTVLAAIHDTTRWNGHYFKVQQYCCGE